jgi:hypothetical protein
VFAEITIKNKSPALTKPGLFSLNRHLYRLKYDFITLGFSTYPGTIRDFAPEDLQL